MAVTAVTGNARRSWTGRLPGRVAQRSTTETVFFALMGNGQLIPALVFRRSVARMPFRSLPAITMFVLVLPFPFRGGLRIRRIVDANIAGYDRRVDVYPRRTIRGIDLVTPVLIIIGPVGHHWRKAADIMSVGGSGLDEPIERRSRGGVRRRRWNDVRLSFGSLFEGMVIGEPGLGVFDVQ